MKVVISSRNFSKETLKEEQKVRIEKKLEKLEKYFHGQVDTSVVLFKRKNDEKNDTIFAHRWRSSFALWFFGQCNVS